MSSRWSASGQPSDVFAVCFLLWPRVRELSPSCGVPSHAYARPVPEVAELLPLQAKGGGCVIAVAYRRKVCARGAPCEMWAARWGRPGTVTAVGPSKPNA
eukprot:12438858-Alexandrium_andersonii.AAC.1